VNDGSDIDIKEECVQCQNNIDALTILQLEKNQGKGHACRHGIKSEEAQFYIYTDIDFPFTIDSLVRVVNLWKAEKTDVILGVRDQAYYNSIPEQRKIISRTLRWTNRKIMRLKTADTQTGLKGFSNKAKAVFLSTKINRYLFDLEFIKKISKRDDLSIRTIDVKPKSNIQMKNLNVRTMGLQLIDYVRIIFG